MTAINIISQLFIVSIVCQILLGGGNYTDFSSHKQQMDTE